MSLKTFRLKHEARTHYQAYLRLADDHDCGAQMLQHISADAAYHAREFDRVMDELRAIDPTCPASKLTAGEGKL